MEKQIEEVRKTHRAYEAEESSPYVRCIAVPICNRIGNVIAALSVSFPIYQNTLNADTFKQVLFDAKRQLEAALLTLDM